MKPSEAARIAEQAADDSVRAALIAHDRAASIPKPTPPDPRQAPFFDALVTAERSAFARILPRRNRWADLIEFDEQIAQIERQMSETHEELNVLFEQRPIAGPSHERELAEWIAGGRKGPRPVPTAARIEERVAELQADLAAFTNLIEKFAHEKAMYVGKHRKRFEKDAAAARDAAQERLLGLIRQLADARDELRATAQTVTWASLFPHESLASDVNMNVLVGGQVRALREAVPGLTMTLTLEQVIRLLEADASILATAVTSEQQAALTGRDPRDRGALWAQTEAGRQAERDEKAAARRRYAEEWGSEPAEYSG